MTMQVTQGPKEAGLTHYGTVQDKANACTQHPIFTLGLNSHSTGLPNDTNRQVVVAEQPKH